MKLVLLAEGHRAAVSLHRARHLVVGVGASWAAGRRRVFVDVGDRRFEAWRVEGRWGTNL